MCFLYKRQSKTEIKEKQCYPGLLFTLDLKGVLPSVVFSLALDSCDFDSGSLCDWTNHPDNPELPNGQRYDWMLRSGDTPSQNTGPAGDQTANGQGKVCSHLFSCSLQFIVIRHHRNHLHVYNHDQKNYPSTLRAQVSHTLSLSKGKHLAQQASSLEGGRGGGWGGRMGGAITVSHV